MDPDRFIVEADVLAILHARLATPRGVAIVGAGRWGKVLCGVLARFSPRLPHILLVAERNYADTRRWLDSQMRLHPNAGYDRVAVTRSLRQVIESDGIDAAIVCKMASEHYAVTKRLLLADKHVLVEKPLTLREEEARELVDIAAGRQRTLAVGYELMFARTIHHFREILARHVSDVTEMTFEWAECQDLEKWGGHKGPDLSTHVITDLYPHVLSLLLLLLGDRPIALVGVTSRDGYWHAQVELRYGSIPIHVTLDKEAEHPRRLISATSREGACLALDYTTDPGTLDLDGLPLPPDPDADAFPSSLDSELACFFARIRTSRAPLPNAAEQSVTIVRATDEANAAFTARQAREVRPWLWRDAPAALPETAGRILWHHLLSPLLRQQLIDHPKDGGALDRWTAHAFQIVHRFSHDPWCPQAQVFEELALTRAELTRLNAAIRESAFLQQLMLREGPAARYWTTIVPIVQSGALHAVQTNLYQCPLRLGLAVAASHGAPGGRTEDGQAPQNARDLERALDLFDAVFAAMPAEASTLSIVGAGLEPLTNPRLDDIIRGARRHGHRVPITTNGYMLTPHYVRRHEGLWEADAIRIALYGTDDRSYREVTQRTGAFQVVTHNVLALLRARAERGHGPAIGFTFNVHPHTADRLSTLLDLVAGINSAVSGQGLDFIALREDLDAADEASLSWVERRALAPICQAFAERCARELPAVRLDWPGAWYPLGHGTAGAGFAAVTHREMLPKAFPQIAVTIDLRGDVHLYRGAAAPGRASAARFRIGTLAPDRPLDVVVRAFLESGQNIVPAPDDHRVLSAFDRVATRLVLQARADDRAGIPFTAGPIAARAWRADTDRPAQPGTASPFNYWQALFGA